MQDTLDRIYEGAMYAIADEVSDVVYNNTHGEQQDLVEGKLDKFLQQSKYYPMYSVRFKAYYRLSFCEDEDYENKIVFSLDRKGSRVIITNCEICELDRENKPVCEITLFPKALKQLSEDVLHLTETYSNERL